MAPNDARQDVRHLLTINAPGFVPLIRTTREFRTLEVAYFSLQNKVPDPESLVGIPRNDQERLDRVRQISEAFTSTDEAEDAYTTGANPQPTQAMKFINELKPFEVQLACWSLEECIEGVQRGIGFMPSWPTVKKPTVAEYDTFDERFNDVVCALRKYKALCKNIFDDCITFRGRLARNPVVESKTKKDNGNTNAKRNLQVRFANDNMRDLDLPERYRPRKRRQPTNEDDDDPMEIATQNSGTGHWNWDASDTGSENLRASTSLLGSWDNGALPQTLPVPNLRNTFTSLQNHAHNQGSRSIPAPRVHGSPKTTQTHHNCNDGAGLTTQIRPSGEGMSDVEIACAGWPVIPKVYDQCLTHERKTNIPPNNYPDFPAANYDSYP